MNRPLLYVEGERMNQDELVFKRVQRIINDKIGGLLASIDDISREKTFDQLGADSLDKIEIIMDIEDEFCISIADDETEAVKTVEDAIRLVEAKEKEKKRK